MTLSTQFITMLSMVGMGIFFGMSLDTYNRFLKRPKRKSWLVFINDILFWLAQGLIIFYILFLVNKGELRFYIFIALLLGFAAYQSLFKQGYLRLLEIVISMIISIYRFIVKMVQVIVVKPIHAVIMTLISLIILLAKGLYTLVNISLRAILFILRILIKPVQWLLKICWIFLPKGIKNAVEKLYNLIAGFLLRLKKLINNAWPFNKFTKKK